MLDKKRIALLFLIVLTDATGAMAILPVMTVYVLAQFHASPLQAALVLAVYSAAQLVAAPWLGKWSDRIGRRPILLLSQMGTIVSYLLIVFAVPLGGLIDHLSVQIGLAGGLIVLYLARILDGITGGNVSVAQAYASDISAPEARSHALGLVGGASGLGHIVGPAIAGLLAGINLLAPWMAAAGVSVVTLLLTLLWLHEPPVRASVSISEPASPDVPSISSRPITHWAIGAILLIALLISSYMASLGGTFALYVQQAILPGHSSVEVVRTVSVLFTVAGVVMALVQVAGLQPVVSCLGEVRTMMVGTGLLLLSAVGLSVASSVWATVITTVIFALGFGLSMPTLQALATHVGHDQQAGKMLGWLQSATSLAMILGPIWGGFVFTEEDPHAAYLVNAGLMVVAIVLSLRIPRISQVNANQRQAAAMRLHMHH